MCCPKEGVRCSQVRTAEKTFTRVSGKLLSWAAGVLVLFLANTLFAQMGANVLVANPDCESQKHRRL